MTQIAAIPVTPRATYTVSAWVKTSGAAGAQLAVSYWTAGQAYAGATDRSTQMLSGTQDWTLVTFQTTAPAGAAYLRFESRMNGGGTGWTDDITVTRNG